METLPRWMEVGILGITSYVNKQYVEVIHWTIPRCKTSYKTVDVCTAIDCSLGPCLDGRISIPGELASIYFGIPVISELNQPP